MDSFLAELYGTNEPAQEDFEKVAHLDFLEKVAAEEGIDLNELSDEDLEELAEVAAEALDEASDEEYEDDGEYEEEEVYEDDGDDLEKEAEAKVEEADFLGRVMAHSFNQELDSIEEENFELEKDAGRYAAWKAGRPARKAARAARRAEAKARSARASRAAHKAYMKDPKYRASVMATRRLSEPSTFKGRMQARAERLGRKVDAGARRIGTRLGAESDAAAKARGAAAGRAAGMAQPRPGGKARRAVDWMTMGKRRRGRAGARAGAAEALQEARKSQRRRGYGAMGAAAGLGAAAGGAAYGMSRKEKKSADEMWEDAIQARAWEHLMAAGLADDQGNFIPAEELDKTAGTDDMEYEVDAAALELLESEGYPVEWY